MMIDFNNRSLRLSLIILALSVLFFQSVGNYRSSSYSKDINSAMQNAANQVIAQQSQDISLSEKMLLNLFATTSNSTKEKYLKDDDILFAVSLKDNIALTFTNNDAIFAHALGKKKKDTFEHENQVYQILDIIPRK